MTSDCTICHHPYIWTLCGMLCHQTCSKLIPLLLSAVVLY